MPVSWNTALPMAGATHGRPISPIPVGGLPQEDSRELPFGPGLALGVVLTWFSWPWLGPRIQYVFFDLVILGVANNNLDLPNYVRIDEDPLDLGRSFLLDFFRERRTIEEETTSRDAVLAAVNKEKLSWHAQVASEVVSPGSRPQRDQLSAREMSVLHLMSTGLTTTEIAKELSLSPKTVSTYRSRVLRKLDLKNNAQLVAYVVRNDLLH